MKYEQEFELLVDAGAEALMEEENLRLSPKKKWKGPQTYHRVSARKVLDVARESLRRLELYEHYAGSYGNSRGECEYGYPQHPGNVCALCQHDNSDNYPCPKMHQNADCNIT